MSRMIKSRWKSKFARFVLGYAQGMRDTHNHTVAGPTLLARNLGIHPSAIYQWIRGASALRPWRAETLRRLASERGVKLTLEHIYQHSRQFRSGRRLEAKSDSPTRTAAKILPFPSERNRRTVIAQLSAK